ncbi:thymidine phosphorylase family protein [Phenylobacterium kunshanense]|uniref:Putative thymidine phosphorylase n=1 Tax=Phenylobacterium kunshanense TaxID=1445034 RepID=A0A328BPZ2_9CAUL|nr:thymidine phosphorylase family protein [Phenylobacterium kunshanense]RAK68745.1 thymidine phosphorylase [Phenylobacterium kunshanense]
MTNLTAPPTVRARRLKLLTQHDAIVLMHEDCAVCRSEGHAPRAQVMLSAGGREVMATLYQIGNGLVAPGEAGLSEAAWQRLGLDDGDEILIRHPPALESLSNVRRRIHGRRLDAGAMTGIVRDVAAGRYTDVHLSAFLTACSALPLDAEEVIHLTRAMVDVGERLEWGADVVVDKHSVGGLPGNRTTPLVVAIVAAQGLVIPKTSSRAITSPAGTADTMETLTNVALDLPLMRRVVEQEGGCLAWGGAVQLSPADDVLIRIERVLDIDTVGQLVASVLSKKIAAGSTHVVLDIPVGPTAKVRSDDEAATVSASLTAVAEACGLKVVCLQTDGGQPVGRGIGPALEARDVLAVLQGAPEAPADLRRRACRIAGAALELAGRCEPGQGTAAAEETLRDGRAWRKFVAICEAQGGLKTPPRSTVSRPLLARHAGRVSGVNNRTLARLAKLAGAPDDKAAGVELHVRLGDEVAAGEPLLTVHAEAPGELAYALDYAGANPEMISVEA